METTVFDNLAFFDMNPMHLAIILLIVLVLFGGSRLKELLGGLGQGVKEFKKGLNDEDESHNKP